VLRLESSSASPRSLPETRVWASRLSVPHGIWSEPTLTRSSHQSWSEGCTTIASECGKYTQADPLTLGALWGGGGSVPQYNGWYSDTELRHRLYIPEREQAYGYASSQPTGMIDPNGLSAAATIGRICMRIPHPAARVAGALILAFAASEAIDHALDQERACDDCETRTCPPCNPPAGTVGYRWDRVPPSRPAMGIQGDHLNLYFMNQNPRTCECFWNRHPIHAVPPPPQPGWVPLPGTPPWVPRP
jgi:hypothetical protein